jgi:hypothetical protein
VVFPDLDNRIRILLIGEIRRNCDFALLAHKDMVMVLSKLKSNDKDLLDRFWLAVESFLMSVANISKILWPSAPELSNRRKDLRVYLSIDDNSPLRSRTFRNHCEHYDERIEEWAKDYGDKIIIDSNIGSIQQVIIGLNKNNLFYIRNFDPYKFVLTVRGQEYEFNHVLTAIKNLQKWINR